MAGDDEHPQTAEGPEAKRSRPDRRPLPSAWQPLTWRGVAAFSAARLNRLLIAQTIVALIVVGTVLWFLDTGWFPAIRETIARLPATGGIENGQLLSPHASREPLFENRLLTFAINLDTTHNPNAGGDLRIEFRRESWAICSMFGCWSWNYPGGQVIPLNQPDLQSLWGAWETMIYLWIGLAVWIGLFVSWFLLATLYSPMLRVYAFFKDCDLNLAGSWKLAGAALLPGALLVSAALVLYGLDVLNLFSFLLIWLLHFFVAWIYLFISPRRLPTATDAVPSVRRNPFGTPPKRSVNPFT